MITRVRIAVASLAILTVAGGSCAEQSPDKRGSIYVTSQDEGVLTQIDPGSMQKRTFAIPRGAVALAPVAASGRLILAYPDSQTLQIFNLADRRIERKLPSAGQPFGLAYEPHTGHIFVGDWTGDRVSMIDIQSGRILRQTKTGKAPAHLVFDARDHRIFVCEREANTVGVFDSVTLDRVADITVGRAPFAIAYSAVNRRVYVANVQSNDISVIDAERLRLVGKNVRVGSMPYGLALSPDEKQLAVTSQATNSVIVLSATDLTKILEVSVGQYPEGVVFGPSGRLYVADWFADAVSVVDTSTRKEIAKVQVGAGPRYLALVH